MSLLILFLALLKCNFIPINSGSRDYKLLNLNSD